MSGLFDDLRANEVQRRLSLLRPDSVRQWGTMTPAQMLAHCAGALEMASGDRIPPRLLLGRIIGWLVKPLVFGNAAPLRRNSPTAKDLVVRDERDLDTERRRLQALIERFAAGGPAGCTTHPHSFFGRLTPQEWSVLMYKHLDHHLRQFGA
jgi:hypothetical protein